MDEKELKYMDLAYTKLRETKYHGAHDLNVFLHKQNPGSFDRNMKYIHLYSYMECFGIISINPKAGNNNQDLVSITNEGMKYISIQEAIKIHEDKESQKSTMIELDIKRAKNDIFWGTYGIWLTIAGSLLGIILGAIANQTDWFGLIK